MAVKQLFNYPAVDTLIACETILNQSITYSEIITAKRSSWKGTYFPDLLKLVQDSYSIHLGIDNAKALRKATALVRSIQSSALDELKNFKAQIGIDFGSDKTRRDEIFNSLGLTKNFMKAASLNHEALVQLLNQFNNNMTPELEKEITDKGMDLSIITAIKGFAVSFTNANTAQETAKGTRKTISADSMKILNDIYKKVIGICTIAKLAFKNDKEKRDLFAFSRVIKSLGSSRTKAASSDAVEQAAPEAQA